MLKKIFATLAIGLLTALAIPTAASAYAPGVNITINGNIGPGATVNIIVINGTFIAGENVNFQVSGAGAVQIASLAVTTDSVVKTANAQGGATAAVTLPTNARGSYNVTATGLESGTVVSTAITVPAADSVRGAVGDDLAFTGSNGVSMLAIWTASGLALLGIALLVVMNVVRRQRSNA